MLIGDARVSTAEQSLALQQDVLAATSCERVFTDVASGAALGVRPQSEADDDIGRSDA